MLRQPWSMLDDDGTAVALPSPKVPESQFLTIFFQDGKVALSRGWLGIGQRFQSYLSQGKFAVLVFF